MPEGGADNPVRRVSRRSKALTHVHAGAELGGGGEDGLGEDAFDEEAVVSEGRYGAIEGTSFRNSSSVKIA